MQEEPSSKYLSTDEKRLLWEIAVTVANIKETEETRHKETKEHRESVTIQLAKLSEVPDFIKEQSKKNTDLGERVKVLETEKNIWSKIISPFVGIVSGFVSAWATHKIK